VYSLKFYILWLLITKFLSMCALFRTLLSFYTKITSLDMKTNISLNDDKNSASVQTLSYLKALVVKNSVLHDFSFGKVSRIHETFLMELQLFGWRHFSKTEVVQNTVLNH